MTVDPGWAAKARAEDTLKWLEASGPLYVDMELVIVAFQEDGVQVYCRGDKPADGFLVDQRHTSFAGWHQLQQAKVGDCVDIKCRCDELASTQ